ncbi:acyl-CoA dehydrogenase family protein (plasmid) [Streptomyces sp. CA-294286]|uniref:acyl-CoA dehydrogenase family protein n=1 Tax=Streptomyces sp. CA-294286 TaxID=3240070 RepID=UPI003D8F2D40
MSEVVEPLRGSRPGPTARSAPAGTGSGRELWARLGAAGALRGLYQEGQPERGIVPDRLRDLIVRSEAQEGTGPLLSVCVQAATVLPLLAEAGRRGPAVGDVGRRMLDGRSVVALAATDSGPGSDLTALTTHAEETGTGTVLRGTKRWITNAVHADLLLVLARRRPGPHFTHFSWYLVPADDPRVQVEAAPSPYFTGSGTGHVHLDGVPVLADGPVGGAGRGLPLFARHIAVERLAGGLWAAAACRRALADTRDRLAEHGLWEQPAIRQRLAAALVRTRQLEALVETLGSAVAAEHDHTAAALVKAAAGETADHVLDVCAHLSGADGFAAAGMQHRRAEAALFGIAGGSTETVLASVADQAEALLPRPCGVAS